MNRMGLLLVLLMGLSSVSCSTYRAGNAGYRGVGDYRVAGDYEPAEREIASRPYRPSGPFQIGWPVGRIKINRGFKPHSDPKHQGVDLGGKYGTPILSAHEGVVIYTGREFRGYGNMVLVEYGDEWASLYAHLTRINVEPGQIVRAGEELGTMGKTGTATGVHLHFELLHNRQPIDPLPYLSRSNRFARSP